MKILEIIKRKKASMTIDFEKLADKWLEYKKRNIKQSTYSNYKYVINKYLMPYLQGKKISELEKYDFNELVDDLFIELAPKTVRDIVCILKAILCYTEDEYNCKLKTDKIKAPKQDINDIEIFNKAEKNRIEKCCIASNSTKELGILVCLNTGMRIGEICALKWKNIDIDKRIIYVNSTLERIYDEQLKRTKIIIDKPKTKKSIREIPMSNKLYNILKPLKKIYKDEDFFITGKSDRFLEPITYRYTYKKVLKKSKVKKHKFHCLRHSFASECIEVGMDVKAVSEILGHSNVSITLNRYVHPSYKEKRKYLEKI